MIVGIVALPLAIAFAIASGVTPDRGLYTAIIAGFLISTVGCSRVQIASHDRRVRAPARHHASLAAGEPADSGPFFFGAAYLLDEIGDDNIFGNVDDARNRARTHLGLAMEPTPDFATPTVAREGAAREPA
jgi:MFS superfamily sulfate permease-like transporter